MPADVGTGFSAEHLRAKPRSASLAWNKALGMDSAESSGAMMLSAAFVGERDASSCMAAAEHSVAVSVTDVLRGFCNWELRSAKAAAALLAVVEWRLERGFVKRMLSG